MSTRRLYTSITFLVLLSLLVSCAPKTATPTEEVSEPTEAVTAPTEEVVSEPPAEEPELLRVWLSWPESPDKIQAFFDGYTELTGVPVEVNSGVDYMKMIAGISGAEAPDLIVQGDMYTVSMWAMEGMIAPLDELITENEIDIDDIYDPPLSQCIHSGSFYCLPWGVDNYALYWNKDMFAEAGLDPDTPPKTLEEMLEFSDILTKTDEDGNLLQVGFIPDFPWFHTDLYLAMFGSTWQSPDGTEVWLDTPEMIAMMKWQQEFYTRYGAENVSRFLSAAGNYLGADSGFYTDKIAMLVIGEWMSGPDYLQKFRPDMDYGIAPMPYPEGFPEREGTSVLWGTCVMIPSSAANIEASAELMAWMMLPGPQVDMMIQIPNLPSSRAAAADPRWSENEDLALFIEMMNSYNAQALYMGPVTTDILMAIMEIQERAFLGGEDPEQLLREFDQTIQEKLDGILGQ
ncbi:MAG: extracellular solute-binding protein [Anaerolineaceae bacterium]|nr:MAG: extracellular solute-binding protein [Anaerolineaceae bacterium]